MELVQQPGTCLMKSASNPIGKKNAQLLISINIEKISFVLKIPILAIVKNWRKKKISF
jgi:hypothetical protein